MRKVTIGLVVLGVLALAFISMPMRAQNQTYPSPDYPFPGYPPQFAPSRTSRALPTPDLTPPPKFKKFKYAVPNQYIVVLNDDAVSQARTHVERRALVANLAKQLAPGAVKIPYVWADALNGFCVELPNEAAAIALSQNPQVKYVESNGLGSLTNTDAPEWLDRLDQLNLPLDHSFTPNRTGAGVTVYDVGTGVNINHTEFGGRAFIADDEVAKNSQPPECAVDTCTWKSATDNDCDGHGTAMLGLIGGTTYGVAKSATLGSVKTTYPSNGSDCFEYAWIVAGINWVTAHHNDHPTQLEVANCSFETVPNIPDIQYPNPDPDAIRNAVVGSMNSGVSYTIAVGNENQSLDNPQTARKTPRDVMDLAAGRKAALLIGAENQETDYRLVVYKADGTIASGSTYGSKLSLFSPGYRVTSASSESNIATNINDSTSRASAIAAGVLALYLQGRTGMNDCGSHPIQGTASSTTGAAIATCPDRVSQFIRANANICDSAISGCQRINDRGASPDRLLYIGYMPPTDNFNFNPIDNHRFFVWQQYEDFLATEPDENGLDWWTSEITGHGHGCNAGMNDNNTCTHGWRVLDSRAFWVALHPDWFTGSWGLASYTGTDTANARFVKECYLRYLHRTVNSSDSDVHGWVTDLTNNYGGDPANPDGVLHMIDAFLSSNVVDGYRLRFGGS